MKVALNIPTEWTRFYFIINTIWKKHNWIISKIKIIHITKLKIVSNSKELVLFLYLLPLTESDIEMTV